MDAGARVRLAVTSVAVALTLGACGGDDGDSADRGASGTGAAQGQADLAAIKTFLLEHTERLSAEVTSLREGAERYYAMAKATKFDYDRLLAERRPQVRAFVKQGQRQFAAANPAYEEMEGVVAGVPSLAEFDVSIDAGGDASDPENAVPFSIRTSDGRTFKQPGKPQLPGRDLAVRHRAEVRRQGRPARPRRRRPRGVRRGAARRLVLSGRHAGVRAHRRAISTPRRASGSRRCRTRSPRWW